MIHIERAPVQLIVQAHRLATLCFPDPWSLESFQKMYLQPGGWLGVLMDDDIVIGYAYTTTAADCMEIMSIAVSPCRQGHGLGRSFMEQICLRAMESGCKEIFLEARESNQIALELYASMGFVRTGRRKEYYRSPTEDAILMTLFLSDEPTFMGKGRTDRAI